MRLESEGRGRTHPNSSGPVPTARVASLVKGGDALTHLACIPGLCVTRGTKAKHVGCGERPGKGLGGMCCSGPNHLGPRAPPWVGPAAQQREKQLGGGRQNGELAAGCPQVGMGFSVSDGGPWGSEHPFTQAASYMGSGCLWSPHLDDFYNVHLGSCSRRPLRPLDQVIKGSLWAGTHLGSRLGDLRGQGHGWVAPTMGLGT